METKEGSLMENITQELQELDKNLKIKTLKVEFEIKQKLILRILRIEICITLLIFKLDKQMYKSQNKQTIKYDVEKFRQIFITKLKLEIKHQLCDPHTTRRNKYYLEKFRIFYKAIIN